MTERTAQALAEALWELVLAGENYLAVAAKDIGVSVTELQAISFLMAKQECGQTELSNVLSLTAGSTTTLVDRLEEKGLARRRPHPTDRRRYIIEFVEPDAEAAERLGSWLLDVATTIPPPRRSALVDLLTELASGIRTRVQDTSQGGRGG